MRLLLALAAGRKIVDLPEAANSKCAFAWLSRIAIEQIVAGSQLLLHAVIGSAHAIRIRGLESIPRQQQQRRVHFLSIEHADVALQLLVPRAGMYLICDSLPLADKKFCRSVFEDAFLRHADQAIERRPAHQPRISVVLFPGTSLPDARVRASSSRVSSRPCGCVGPRRCVRLQPVWRRADQRLAALRTAIAATWRPLLAPC